MEIIHGGLNLYTPTRMKKCHASGRHGIIHYMFAPPPVHTMACVSAVCSLLFFFLCLWRGLPPFGLASAQQQPGPGSFASDGGRGGLGTLARVSDDVVVFKRGEVGMVSVGWP